MKKEDAKAIVSAAFESNFSAAQKQSWNRQATGMPLLEGETYHVPAVTEKTINVGTIGAGAANAGDKYLQIPTVEGTNLGIAQIARMNNGLNLKGETRADLVAHFIAKVNTYCEKHPEGWPIKVKSLKARPGQNGQMVIPTFSLTEDVEVE